MPRVFGILVAAGRSRRMGQPKQLLAIDGASLLVRMVEVMLASALDGLVVVTNDTVNNALRLSDDSRFTTIMADPDAEMIESILLGVSSIETTYAPSPDDGLLVCPGDLPRMTTAVVEACNREYRVRPGRIVAAAASDRPRHPIIIPHNLAGDLEKLRGVGLAGIFGIRADRMQLVRVEDEEVFRDMDTPEDYRDLP